MEILQGQTAATRWLAKKPSHYLPFAFNEQSTKSQWGKVLIFACRVFPYGCRVFPYGEHRSPCTRDQESLSPDPWVHKLSARARIQIESIDVKGRGNTGTRLGKLGLFHNAT
jgi:hypothetical protein